MTPMTVAELIEVLGRQNPAWEIHSLVCDAYGEVTDVRVDDAAQIVTLISDGLT